jgi:hydroxylaminobenzene mutase
MENSTFKKQQSNRLIYLGVLLFLLGLITGLAAQLFANPRMGVSSHIEGVLNGMFLIVLGLIWNKISLSDNWLKITFWLAIYGTFMNWFGILIAAIFNAGKNLGIMANGQEGSPVAEGFVGFSLISLSVAMVVICITILVGLWKNMVAKV